RASSAPDAAAWRRGEAEVRIAAHGDQRLMGHAPGLRDFIADYPNATARPVAATPPCWPACGGRHQSFEGLFYCSLVAVFGSTSAWIYKRFRQALTLRRRDQGLCQFARTRRALLTRLGVPSMSRRCATILSQIKVNAMKH